MKSEPVLRDVLASLEKLSMNEKVRHLGLDKAFDEARKALEYSIQNMLRDNLDYAKSLHSKSLELIRKVESTSQEPIHKEVIEELKLFLKYCRMSVYEFTDKIREVRRAYRAYLWGMIIFLILGGTYRMEFAISAIVLVFPIILAMGGLRRRSSMGLMLAYATIPLPLVIFVMILSYAAYAITDPEEVSSIASAYGVSLETAFALIVLVTIGSAAGLGLLLYALKKLVDHRYAFF